MRAPNKLALMLLGSLIFNGCAQPVTHQEPGPLWKSPAVSTAPSRPLVCRIHQEDKVFNDAIAFRIPVHDDKHTAPMNCDALVAAEKSTLDATRTIPTLDLGFIWLGAAAQWMSAHPEVHQCVEKLDAPNFVLARFLGRAVGTKGPTLVLLRNCDGHIFFVTNAEIPEGAAACGEAHIEDCPFAVK